MNCIICDAKLYVQDQGKYWSLACPNKDCKSVSWHWAHQLNVDKITNKIITYSFYITVGFKKYNIYGASEHNLTVLTHRPDKYNYNRIIELDFVPLDAEGDLKSQVYGLFERLMKLIVFS